MAIWSRQSIVILDIQLDIISSSSKKQVASFDPIETSSPNASPDRFHSPLAPALTKGRIITQPSIHHLLFHTDSDVFDLSIDNYQLQQVLATSPEQQHQPSQPYDTLR